MTDHFEKELVDIMIRENCSLGEALDIAFDGHGVDKESALDMVDFLEYMLVDLDKVEVFMQTYLGQVPDIILTKGVSFEEKAPNEV